MSLKNALAERTIASTESITHETNYLKSLCIAGIMGCSISNPHIAPLKRSSKVSIFSDFEVVVEAVDGKEAIESVGRLKPDLVLMDLSMPKTDGITAIKEIKNCLPETKILALTVHKTEGHVRMAFESGVDGYILKDASCTELEVAIRNILEGKSYLSPEISDGNIRGYLWGPGAGPQ